MFGSMRPLFVSVVAILFLAPGGAAGATARAGEDGGARVGGPGPAPTPTALDGDGMWIWYVSRAGGGSVQRIAATAKRRGIETVFIKSSDGSRYWGQFSRRLVRKLKSRGLNVCAWQYVYGDRPTREAAVGARAVRAGADCLVIDAESQYEGKYASARTYVRGLRARIGADYPLGLAGFPYVHYHPAFPYSVFLGPGGAQFNLPQMYWRAIGTTVSRVYSTTYLYNRVYGRPIHPLGQVYQNPTTAEILRFRSLAAANGATGVSWWSWHTATRRGWRAVARPLPPPVDRAPKRRGQRMYPLLERRARGDLVVWAQQHLVSAGIKTPVDGVFGWRMWRAVRAFRAASGLPKGGAIGDATWQALLRFTPDAPAWGRRRARASRARDSSTRKAPRSASLPAVRMEIPPREIAPGAGRPRR